MSSPETQTLLVDCSKDQPDSEGVAAIAVVTDTGKIVATEIVRATSANVAEGLAVIRAQSFAATHGDQGNFQIVTDSETVMRAVEGIPSVEEQMDRIGAVIRAGLERPGIELVCRPRYEVKLAHQAARHVLRAWAAGIGDVFTWEPSPYAGINYSDAAQV